MCKRKQYVQSNYCAMELKSRKVFSHWKILIRPVEILILTLLNKPRNTN